MKTPEEMAEEYANSTDSCDVDQEYAFAYKGFLAGYQAAKEEQATKDQKIAELWTESIRRMLPSVHEITLFPSKPSNDEVVAKMDAAIEKAKGNSSNNSNGWISVKDRLPEIGDHGYSEDVLLLTQVGRMEVSHIEKVKRVVKWRGIEPVIETENGTPIEDFTHWMPLPKRPEDK